MTSQEMEVERAISGALSFAAQFASAKRAQGYTREIWATTAEYDLHLLVKPDADLDGEFRACCLDECDVINVQGWLFEIEDA